ncbi:MAG: HEAT repeat domain-containing protein, partial [Planctomycetes bacterium]|nr:HEAT repeat domain-containing protein [Planctomycetota bacterium]
KRFLYDSGVRVPLIVRVPSKYQPLAGGEPGTKQDRLVSFIDFAPTVLSLAGLQIPSHMQGGPFLGPKEQPAPEYVHLHRDRTDERYDLMRGVRDGRYKYIRNYMPHRIYGQHIDYFWEAPSLRSWEQEYDEGRCDEVQSVFWRVKAREELYDTQTDPDEVKNLAEDPACEEILKRLRQAHRAWSLEVRDSGFLPEGEMQERAGERTVFDVVQSPDFPLERIIDTADRATRGDASDLPGLIERFKDKESAVRYWAATGCTLLQEKAGAAGELLIELLGDRSQSVRIAAAEALCFQGKREEALPVLLEGLEHSNPKHVLHALNVLEELGKNASAARASLIDLVENTGHVFVKQAAEHILGRFIE